MIGFFARHPVAANLFMIAGLFLGLTAVGGMERETFPEFSSSRVAVTVAYPGAAAEDVDKDVCLPLEEALQAIADLDEMTCRSVSGLATATLTMVEDGDITQFFNDVSSEVSAIQDLPDDAEDPRVEILGLTEQIAVLAVSGLASDAALVRYADELSTELAALPGVATATVRGISTLEYRIALDEAALQRFGLSPRAVADAITLRTASSPLGTVETETLNYSLRIDGTRRDVADLKPLTIVEGATGGVVRLSDIADVSLVLADPALRSAIDGQQAAIIVLTKAAEDDAIDAFAAVDAHLSDLRDQVGGALDLTIIDNGTEVISDRIGLVLRNAVQSLVLVFVVMCAFFSLRDALWISMALPFSFLTALFVMTLFGITINVVSVLALLMSIGIIMDDSLVIAENIDTWRGRLSPKEASVRGAQEVAAGVVSSFLTTAAVFAPLMFLSGEIGAILRVIPVVLLITLAASLVEAFLILPHHLSHGRERTAAARERLIPRLLTTFCDRGVVPVVTALTHWRYATLGVVVAALILTLGLVTSGQVRLIGFPETDGDTLEIRIAMTPGLQIAQTEQAVAAVLAGIDAADAALSPGTDEGVPLVQRVMVEYGRNPDTSNTGPHTATITVDLLTSEARNAATATVLDTIRDAAGPIPDLSQINFATTSLTPGGSDIDISLYADDLAALQSASAALLAKLSARADVRSVHSDVTPGQDEVRLELNAYGRSLGLTTSSLADQLRTSFSGTTTDSFRLGETRYDITVSQAAVADSLHALRALPITLPSGEQTALSQVALIEERPTQAQITREGGKVRAQIIGDIDRAVQTANGIGAIVLTDHAPEITRAYPGVSIATGGATESQAETQGAIMGALSIGLVAVYIVLAFQFRSYVLPVIIMTAIPFALIGVILGHLVVGIDMSMPSLIGFASLAGIVVNNAILFVAFFEEHAKGGDHVAAAVEAMRRRFRPVVLASTTTFIGLLPVVFETSPSLVTIVPVVVSVAFGVLASLLLVVLVFPSVLAAYFDVADVDRWIAGNTSHPEPEGATP